MADLAISALLSSRGYEGEGAERAREQLYREGLTRPGKKRIAKAKLEAVDRALGAAFVRHCPEPVCHPPTAEAREPVLVTAEHCETCRGSDNRRAVERMLAAMRRAGWSKLLVAGGSPTTRVELERLCGGRVELRFVTDDSSPNRRTVAPLVDWSDIAVIWTSTQISHKATTMVRGPKVVKAPRRGIAALADAVAERCDVTD